MFTNGQEDQGSIPSRVIPKTQKWYLMPSCLTLSIIRCGLRVSGAIQRNELYHLPYFGLVVIEKGAFRLPSTTVANLLIFIYIYITCSGLYSAATSLLVIVTEGYQRSVSRTATGRTVLVLFNP